MNNKEQPKQPARLSGRVVAGMGTEFETVAFARRRDKRRNHNRLAKASRKKNR